MVVAMADRTQRSGSMKSFVRQDENRKLLTRSSASRPYTSDSSCGTRTIGCAANRRPISSRYTRSWRCRALRNGSERACRQHPIDDQRRHSHAGLVELFERARGFLDRQPLRNQHQHEPGGASADQTRAQVAQPVEPLVERHHDRISLVVLIGAEHRAPRARHRLDPRLHQLRHADQAQGVSGRRGVEDDQSNRVSSPRISVPMRSSSATSSAPGIEAARSICRFASFRIAWPNICPMCSFTSAT